VLRAPLKAKPTAREANGGKTRGQATEHLVVEHVLRKGRPSHAQVARKLGSGRPEKQYRWLS